MKLTQMCARSPLRHSPFPILLSYRRAELGLIFLCLHIVSLGLCCFNHGGSNLDPAEILPLLSRGCRILLGFLKQVVKELVGL